MRQIVWTRDRDHRRDRGASSSIRNHRVLQPLPLRRDVHRRSCCCCCRSCPGSAATGQRRAASGSASATVLVPARRARQDRAGDLLRRLPRAPPRLAVDGRAQVPRHAVPARPRPRADPRGLGAVDGGHRVPARPRHRAALLRPVPRDALRRHRAASSWILLGLAPVLRRRARREPDARLRRRPLRRLARRRSTRTIYDADRRQLPARAGPVRPRQRRAHRHRTRAGAAPTSRRSPQSDYIIASLGEELGLVGVFAILALYLLFVVARLPHRLRRPGRLRPAARRRPRRSSSRCRSSSSIGGVTRVIPLTGLTTPFLAAGGSSLVANWIIVALLLRLSDSVRNQPAGRGGSTDEPRTQARQRSSSLLHVPRAVRLDDDHPVVQARRPRGRRPQRPHALRELLGRARPDPRRRRTRSP